jgi:hypothetical protein
MKFLCWYEYTLEDLEELQAKSEELYAEQKAHPEKYGKFLRFPDGSPINFNTIGEYEGFSLWEAENEDQLYEVTRLWEPELTIKWIPIRQGPLAKQYG